MKNSNTERVISDSIVAYFLDHINITHFVEDFVLVADIVDLFENKYEPRVVTSAVLKHLKNTVKLNYEKPPINNINNAQKTYQSIVKGKFNKRAYLGIQWKDVSKNQKYYSDIRHIKKLSSIYKMNELIDSSRKRQDFIEKVNSAVRLKKINWNFANSSYYNTILLIEMHSKLDSK